MEKTEDNLKKALVCETYKKVNGDYPKLYLIPLKNTREYGTLFLGSCSEYEIPTDDYSNSVWRFGANGGVERAEILSDLSSLSFKKTPYKFAAKIEEVSMENLFGMYEKRYQRVMDELGGQKPMRLKRFVTKHPQLEYMKLLARRNPEKIAAIIAAAGLAISGLTHATNKLNNIDQIPDTTTNPITQEIAETSGTSPYIIIQESDSISQENDTGVEVDSEAKFEEISSLIMDSIEEVRTSKQSYSAESRFFSKYSSTLNPDLNQKQDKNDQTINSIEEFLDCYKNDPKRFAIYGNRFLAKMQLDYMKIKLAEVYGISDPENIKLTYEQPIGAYEVRVRYNDKQLENPGFGVLPISEKEPLQKIRVIEGTRSSRISKKYWDDFFAISEYIGYSKVDIINGYYTLEQYNDAILDSALIIAENMKEMVPNAKYHLNYEEESR